MATLYWVGGTGGWDDPSHWATESGGTSSGVAPTASAVSLTNTLVGAAGTADTTIDSGTNDNGWFLINLGFTITYLGVNYTSIYVGTNGYITFTGGSTSTSTTASGISLPKLFISNAGDHSCQRIYYQSTGSTPNRTYWVRYEGTNATTGTLGSPNQVWEVVFYENNPTRIDIHYGSLASAPAGAGAYNAYQQIGSWTAAANTSFQISTTGPSGSLPTTVDDVVFDSASSASAYTVTIFGSPVCRNWTLSGPASGNVTIAGNSVIRIYGGVTWASIGITRSYSGTMFFDASSGTHTVNFGGISLAQILWFGDGQQSTATWNLGASITVSNSSAYIYVISGTFSTQNFNITTNGRISSAFGTYLRTIDFGTSTISITGSGNLLFELNPDNLTFNASSSTIRFPGAGSGMTFNLTGGLTYGTLEVDATQDTNSSTIRANVRTGTGAVNINTLKLLGGSRLRSYAFVFANATYNIGTLTTDKATTYVRERIILSGSNLYPSAPGPTLNVTTIGDTTEAYDFRGIAATGSATWSGPWGDWGGNTGITFPASKTVYLRTNGTYGIFDDATYSNVSGGSTSNTHFPLAQDTVIIDNNCLSSTVSLNTYSSGALGCLTNLDFSNRTTPLTFNWQYGMYLKGNIIGSSAVSSLNSNALILIGSSNASINTNGMILPSVVIAKNSGVSVDLLSAVISAAMNLNGGILNTNSYNITTTQLLFSGSVNPIVFNSGTSILYITSTGFLTFQFVTYSHTFDVANSKFVMFGTGNHSLSYNYPNAASPQDAKFYYDGASGGSLTLTAVTTGSYSIKYFESTKRNAVIQINTNRNFTFTQTFKIRSNLGDRAQLKATSTTPVSINYTGAGVVDLDYIDVSYVNCSVANKFFAGKNSVSVVGTNTNWTFGNYSKRPQKGNALSFLG